MTALNTDLIARHAAQARALLAGDPDVNLEQGEAALTSVVNEYVDALLVELERLTDQDVLDMLGSIGNALRNGSYMTNANLALNLLCVRLGVDRDRLVFNPGRIGEIAAEFGQQSRATDPPGSSCPDCECCTRDDRNRRACGSCPCTEG